MTLKVRFASFRTITRSRTLPAPVDAGTILARIATELLAGVDPSPGVRLLGVSVSNLVAGPARQLALEDALGGPDPAPAVASAVDQVRRRFGDRAVGPATLLRGAEGMALKRPGDQPWGPSGPASGQPGPSGPASG